MSLNRYARKRDANEAPIKRALEALGYSVEQLDVVDLLVEHKATDRRWLLEVKGRLGRLTPRQVEFRRRFTCHVVRSLDEALAVLRGES